MNEGEGNPLLRPRLVGSNGAIIRKPMDGITIQDQHEIQIDELRAELRAGLARLHRQDDVQSDALRIHQESLLLLVPVVHDLEQRTLTARLRRVRQALRSTVLAVYAFRDWLDAYVRGVLIRLGVLNPMIPTARTPTDTSRDVPK